VNHQTSLRLLFTANGISGFAQGISMLAIPWYFAQNSSYFNTAYGIITIIVLFFGLYAGTLVDKYSRKANFMGNSLVCGVLLLLISLIGYQQQQLQDLYIISVFAITMLNYNIHYPTLYAFGQEISAANEYGKVNATIEVVGQSMSILSGGIAAIMLEGGDWVVPMIKVTIHLAPWHIWEIFMLNAITYFIALAFIYFIPYTPKNTTAKTEPILRKLKEGFAYVKKNKRVWWFGLFSYSVFAMLLVEIHAVLPAYIDKHLHAKGNVFAIADGIYALGALCAGLWVNKLFSTQGTTKAVIGLTLLTSAIFYWAFAGQQIWIIYVVSILLGFSNAGIRVLRLTYLFNHIPNELMGRVNSIFNMSNILIRSLFIFLFSTSFFVNGNQIIWAFFIMATFLLISAVVLFLNQKDTK
jgi:MFS family permease